MRRIARAFTPNISAPNIPEPIPPAAPPTLAQARPPSTAPMTSLIPPNIRTGARGALSPASTQKRSLIGGAL